MLNKVSKIAYIFFKLLHVRMYVFKLLHVCIMQ